MSQSDFVSRGQALVAAGQYQEAVKVCRLGLLGRPTTVEGRIVLGQALLALKRFDEVLAEMRVALELDQSSIAAQVLRGEAFLKKGDTAAAIEALSKARQASPGDHRIQQLLAQCEQANARPSITGSHPSASFVASGDTKHYPGGPDDDGMDGLTGPTSLAAPGSLRRSSQRGAAAEPPRSQAYAAMAEKTGTVEVDPDLDGVEIPNDLDDAVAPPPAARPGRGKAKADLSPKQQSKRPTKLGVTPTMDLDIEDLQPAERETKERPSRPGGTALRRAVGRPSGPLDEDSQIPAPMVPPPAVRSKPATMPPPGPRDKPKTVPPPFAQAPLGPPAPLFGMSASPASFNQTQVAPHGQPLPPAQPLPPPPGTPAQRLAAALPTVAAMPQPQPPPSPASMMAAARPTVAIAPPPNELPPLPGPGRGPMAAAWPATPDGMPPHGMPPHGMPHQGMHGGMPPATAASFEPTARPGQLLDPNIIAMVSTAPPPQAAVELQMPPQYAQRMARRPRTNAQIALWVVLGALVIGGGVFAGFQIRAIRLDKKIAAAREHATDLAKADTWSGWAAALTSLAEIAQASATTENLAAYARARAVIAFDFGDGLSEAKTVVETLGGQGGVDGSVAEAYVALARDDAKAAKIAADAALTASSSQDPAALRVAGEAALAAGDPKAAVTYMKEAYGKEPRPLYGVALARAYAAAYAWDDAAVTLEKVLGQSPDHPAALIERARLLARAGRIAPGQQVGLEVKAQLDKLVAEGMQPLDKQKRGVAPAQIAYAQLALARVDFARNDLATSRGDLRSATSTGIDDQHFAEDWVDTLYTTGQLFAARAAAERVIALWPNSRRTHVALAQILIAQGHLQEADEALAKPADTIALPIALAVRAQARASDGDVEGARADYEAALKKQPNLEPALVGRAWLELGAGNLDEARKLVEPRVAANGTSPGVATVYAAVMRRTSEQGARDKAKQMLEKVVAGPPGPDTGRAELELARLYTELGDSRGASAAYSEAIKAGSFEAKLENAELKIDYSDPNGGHDALEGLLKDAGTHPRAELVLEVARARMLVGSLDTARLLLDSAEKLPNVVKWKLDRERGRLALRKGDVAGAATVLSRALEGCGADAETFLLAADTATADDKAAAGLGEKVKKLVPERLKNVPEAAIVDGKLALAAEKYPEALALYTGAKAALEQASASSRRKAQARFGIAVAKYFQHFDVEAERELQAVIALDPSLYAAYLFDATLLQTKKPKEALELAKHAVVLDPDSVDGWTLAGQLAHKLGDKRTLAEAISRLSAIAPASDALKQLQALKR